VLYTLLITYGERGHRGHDRMVVVFITIYAISAYITTDVVSSNLGQSEVYNIM
jgi:hypothetical protein